jgi:Tfp pilus assembly protein PilF
MEEAAVTIGAALAAARAGDDARALAIAEAVLARNPRDPNALQIVGLAKGRLGKKQEALEAFVKADQLAPNHPPILNSIGVLLKEGGDLAGARTKLENAVRLSPNFAEAWLHLASTYALLNDGSAARAAFERATALNPLSADAFARYSRFLEDWHDINGAKAAADRALAIDRANPLALLTLANLDARARRHEAVIGRLQPALASNAYGAINAALLYGPLSRALEKTGRYADSFAACAEANRLFKEHYREAFAGVEGPRSPGTLARLEAFAESVEPTSWTRHELRGDDPAFLLGFPRSGTTLLDQILSSHAEITVLEEKECLVDSWLDLVLKPGGLERWAGLSKEEVERFRAAYWRRVDAHAKVRRPVLIDKLPLDTALLGLVHRIFPRAKIIFALRDPRDVVLSCFQQTFGMNAAMYQFLDLETAASYYDQVMRLGALWRDRLPLDLHVLRYESLVADLRGEARRLLSFLGLAWSDDVLAYDETARRRVIRTPSAKQVIEPLYASSIGKWRNYAAEMASVLPLLDKWAARFGYEVQM